MLAAEQNEQNDVVKSTPEIDNRTLRTIITFNIGEMMNSHQIDLELTKETSLRSRNDRDETKVVATCDNCGKKTILNFEPDLNKPIYCKDCLKKIHQRKPEVRGRGSDFEKKVAEQKPISLKEALNSNTRNFKSTRSQVNLEKPADN